MSVTLEGIKPSNKKEEADMDGKVSITITTDKPVKIRVTPTEESDAEGKEAEGLKRLLHEVKGGKGNVVSQRETRASDKK